MEVDFSKEGKIRGYVHFNFIHYHDVANGKQQGRVYGLDMRTEDNLAFILSIMKSSEPNWYRNWYRKTFDNQGLYINESIFNY